MMQYLVIERFRNGDPAPVYQRFRERGRIPGMRVILGILEPLQR